MRNRATVSLALAILAVTTPAAACGSGKEATKKTTTTKATTTTSKTTSSSSSSTSSTTGAGSTTTTKSGSTSGVNESSFGYVKSAGKQGSGYELTIDYAELLIGDAAVKAAHEDGEIPADQDYIENDYYIRNNNTKLRTFPISSSAKVRMLDDNGGSPENHSATVAEFASSHRDDDPVNIVVTNGEVTSIEEQYFP